MRMSKPHPHQTHPEIVKRLRRAHGHLQKVISMIEEGRPCLDLAQQLHAVESAVREAKKTLIHDHIDHCLELATGPVSREARGPIDEFKSITKYL
jgi:DNA-binding FrmR family transcriptional regulator